MPLGDKTGPLGGGPRTGRQLGRCSAQNRSFPKPTGGGAVGSSFWGRVVLPLSGIILADLMRPNSVLKRLSGEVAKRISAPKQRLLPKP